MSGNSRLYGSGMYGARRWLSAVAVGLCGAGAGDAAAFCEDLHRFMQRPEAAQPAKPEMTLPIPNAAKPTCGQGRLMSGAVSAHCYWGFGYRSDAALQSFGTTLSQVAACLSVTEATRIERSVNHPDSYELHSFDRGAGTLHVSLKDKAALQNTLIFLRMEHLAPDD